MTTNTDDLLPGMSPMNRTVAYCAAQKLRDIGYEWDGKNWALAAPAQPAEPVAYRYKTKRSAESEGSVWHLIDHPGQRDALSASYGAVAHPLYATPPSSQPLTQLVEDLEEALRWSLNVLDAVGAQDIANRARAVLAAAQGQKP